MTHEHPMRTALGELSRTVSRRGFFGKVIRASGLVAAFDQLGPAVFAQKQPPQKTAHAATTPFILLPYQVASAIGRIVIPVDQDPGWATFDPGITQYAVDVFAGQVFLGGNKLVFQGYLGTLSAFNEIPVDIGYSNLTFLEMGPDFQATYFGAALAGLFELDGVQDILNTAALLSLVAVRGTFFSNYPYHIADRNAEFQIIPPHDLKTGWDIMQYPGPIGPSEEQQLRERYFNAEVVPGVDPSNPYI
jgi:hypothetical protein